MACSGEHHTFEIQENSTCCFWRARGLMATVCYGLHHMPITGPQQYWRTCLNSYVNNTLFPLHARSAHRKFHDDLALNEAGGRIASAYFPTSLHCRRAFHEPITITIAPLSSASIYASHEIAFLNMRNGTVFSQALLDRCTSVLCNLYGSCQTVDWNRLFSRGNRFARQTSAEPFLDS